jgi:leucyl-tRNA synthetase
MIDGKRYRRETNTMPQWAGSCWYYLRFIDPKNETAMVDRVKEQAWMPVDLYIGGAEHAVLHLLYARFWHKVLFDRGYVSQPEPFQKLVNQGMILSHAFKDHRGALVSVDLVQEDAEGLAKHVQTGETLQRIVAKMAKSLKNVVDPEGVVKEYGADALRLYEMFMGPLEATKPWSMQGVNGVRNFLDRVWRLIVDPKSEESRISESVQDVAPNAEQDLVVHSTIAAVTQDIENLSFNTAIARMMELVNHFTKESVRPKSAMETLTLLLAPFAPHVSEELWRVLGHPESLAYAPWPKADPEKMKIASVEVPVQVNGKVRTKLVMPVGIDAKQTEQLAMSNPRVSELLEGQVVIKAVVVPGKMINFVIKSN